MADFRGAKGALRKHLLIGAAAVLVLPASHGSAFAYLDPGTGSIILQALIAGIIGSAAFARMYWTRLKGMFRRAFGLDHRESDPESR
jgi:hypothetical protein